jgi:hypothetical protein
LNQNFLITKKTINELEEIKTFQFENKKKEKNVNLISGIEMLSIQSNSIDEIHKNESDEESDEEKVDLNDIILEDSFLHSKKMINLKVKLIIVELHQNNNQRNIRKVLSPIMDSFNIAQKFGLFHSALIVGPFYIEWVCILN